MVSILLANGEAAATLLSVAVAIVIGYAGFRQTQTRARREYTLSVMLQRLSHEDLSRATLLLAEYTKRGATFEETPENQEEHRLVNLLLSYYEFIAIAYIQNGLDRETVRKQQRNSMKAAFRVCEPYILKRRKELSRKTLYSEFEKLTKRYL